MCRIKGMIISMLAALICKWMIHNFVTNTNLICISGLFGRNDKCMGCVYEVCSTLVKSTYSAGWKWINCADVVARFLLSIAPLFRQSNFGLPNLYKRQISSLYGNMIYRCLRLNTMWSSIGGSGSSVEKMDERKKGEKNVEISIEMRIPERFYG